MKRSNLSAYYHVVKPGIIRGNLITVIAGYMFAAKGQYHLVTFLALCAGSAMIIASGCVLNNIFDADIDKKMSRTNKRELVTHAISRRSAYTYAALLGILGVSVLLRWTNILVVLCGVVGHVFYACVYTYAKRKTVWSTLIGTIPGATPPVAGYVAVTGRLDFTSLLLFLVLVSWQMPHFLAIAVRRIEDYRSAHIPVLPLVKGLQHTRYQVQAYIVGFTLVTLYLGLHEHLGGIYTGAMLLIGFGWLYVALKDMSKDSVGWAKKVFLVSLLTLLAFDIAIATVHYF